jgi:regulator of nucleoside diphosphate kinase
MMTQFDPVVPAGRPPIVLTIRDREQVRRLLKDSASTLDPETAEFLREEIERADVAPETAKGMMVGLGCKVKFIDHKEQQVAVSRLVHPDQANGTGCISVLSPIGGALIGLGPGQSIAWTSRGEQYELTVLEVSR